MLTSRAPSEGRAAALFPLPSGKSLHADEYAHTLLSDLPSFPLPSGKSLHADGVG